MSQSSPITIKGSVKKTFFTSPTFSSGVISSSDGEFRFAGPIYAHEGADLKITGVWHDDPKWGRQLKATHAFPVVEFTAKGLSHYLANHPDIKGIGPQKAAVLAEIYGEDLPEATRIKPDEVASLAKVSESTINQLAEILAHSQENEAFIWLSGLGLSHRRIKSLTDALGENIVGILKNDPYLIVRHIKGMGFADVDRIADGLGITKRNPKRITAGILHFLDGHANEGHSCIEIDTLIDRTFEYLNLDRYEDRSLVEEGLQSAIAEGEIQAVNTGAETIVGRMYLFRAEQELARLFRKARASKNPCFDDPEMHFDEIDSSLNRQQRQAVETSLKKGMSLISGVAGSGKSYTLSTIKTIYEAQDKSVLLLAPTGKAAKRLSELGGKAQTIHRILKYDGKSFNLGTTLPYDLIIIDEVSMVDVCLAQSLFQFIDLEKTAIVFAGDHNQLPSVGAGNLLRDIIDHRLLPTTILTEVVRQAGDLCLNSLAILKGQVIDIKANAEPSNNEPPSWILANKIRSTRGIVIALERLIDTKLDTWGFDLIKDVQVLTPSHKGPIGTKELNVHLQRLVQAKCFNRILPEKPQRFYPGDKIIQTKNDYDDDVMNGTIGQVITFDDGTLVAKFEGKTVTYEGTKLYNLSLAYAITIHKSQGSEVPCAVVIMHSQHSFQLDRGLFYTAVTRARRTAIILGDKGVFSAAQKVKANRRHTFLANIA